MGRKMYAMNGGKLGRPKGTNVNTNTFLNKSKSKKIVSLLDKGKSVRDIYGRIGISPNTVIKIKKLILV